jgi:hypothetical protein
MVQLLDLVPLAIALPEYNLNRGQVGTAVEVLRDSGAFEVEISPWN